LLKKLINLYLFNKPLLNVCYIDDYKLSVGNYQQRHLFVEDKKNPQQKNSTTDF